MFLAKGFKGYYYLYYDDELTGKRRKVSTKSKLKTEANEFLRLFKTNEIKSKALNNKPYCLTDLQTEVLKYVNYNLRQSTVGLYERCFKILIAVLENKPLKFVTIHDIEKFKNYRLNQVSISTTNIDIRTCKAIFNLALKWKWISNSPAKEVSLLKVAQKEILSFSNNELEIIFNSSKNHNIKNVIEFALFTGCRLNEILNVQFKDINLIEGIITINNKPDFKTKNGRVRKLPISQKLNNLLQSILNNEGNIFNLYNPEQYLFTKKGVKYNKDYVTKSFKKILRKSNLPEKFHFHCLRHTFITNLIKKNVNINYVKELAGHADISTTMNYIHIVTDDLRAAVNLI